MTGHIGIAIRVIIAVGVLLGLQVAVSQITKGREPDEIRPFSQRLAALPMRLANVWNGRDVEIDNKVAVAVGATDVANREYTEPLGGKIALQLAAFEVRNYSFPHDPRVCYKNSGWKVVKHEVIKLRQVDAIQKQSDIDSTQLATQPAQLIVFQQGNQRIFVLFWYQFGDACAAEPDDLRLAQLKYFGQRSWPSTLKVLIQIDATKLEQAEKSLRTFAEDVLAWTLKLS